VEKEVVELLLKHYNETGSKFILVRDHFELAEKIGANPGEIIEALKNLRQDNIVYLYRSDIRGYWKIGLKKGFVEILEREFGFLKKQRLSRRKGICALAQTQTGYKCG
jgi:DNA-binding transcriptional regulator YhcF (GntR family)